MKVSHSSASYALFRCDTVSVDNGLKFKGQIIVTFDILNTDDRFTHCVLLCMFQKRGNAYVCKCCSKTNRACTGLILQYKFTHYKQKKKGTIIKNTAAPRKCFKFYID